MNGAYWGTDTRHAFFKGRVGGRDAPAEGFSQEGLEGALLHILIEVAFIQVCILGADEE